LQKFKKEDLFMKKLTKKTLSLLLVLTLVVASFVGCSSNKKDSSDSKETNTAKEETEATDAPKNLEPAGQIIVGDSTQLTGDFMEGWTNGASDMYVRELLGTYLYNGYATIAKIQDGSFTVNSTAVKEMTPTENADGTKTFTITINEGLTYNDGTAINAKDYVFNILLRASKAFGELEADTTAYNYIQGFDDFNTGKAKELTGVRLLGDYQFSITVKKEKLPYYYDLTYALCRPEPMAVYAPGVTLQDDGKGAYFSDNFSKDIIEGPIKSERYKPTVVAGPYVLESYDEASTTATLVVNDKYVGNFEGQKPQIEKIIYKYVIDATSMDELKTGSVDLLSTVSGGDEINAGLDLVDEGIANYNTYLRNGFGKLVFTCDIGPTQFVAVRQAIAHLLDRNEFAAQYSGGYASVVSGDYGLAQWMYQERKDAIDSSLDTYAFDIEAAKKLLIDDGWTLNKDGKDFVEGTDDVRYKDVDGELMPLVIQWANTANNPVSDLLSTMLPSSMEQVGMKLEATTVDWGVLSNNVYRQGIDEPKYNMFNMGVGFADVFDPSLEYSLDEAYMGLYNSNYIKDQELYDLAIALRNTDSSDREGYADKWVEFQKRWNYLVPDLPLYSDEYHDFFNKKLVGYEASSVWEISFAILYAHVEE
jgi:peptide/nickel transport system substrate-binding protein